MNGDKKKKSKGKQWCHNFFFTSFLKIDLKALTLLKHCKLENHEKIILSETKVNINVGIMCLFFNGSLKTDLRLDLPHFKSTYKAVSDHYIILKRIIICKKNFLLLQSLKISII